MDRLRALIVRTWLLLAVVALAGAALGMAPASILAASPAPSAAAGDTRSAGEAPGFVGAPFLAVGAVLVIGGLAAVATIAYVRLTGGPGRTAPAAERAAAIPGPTVDAPANPASADGRPPSAF